MAMAHEIAQGVVVERGITAAKDRESVQSQPRQEVECRVQLPQVCPQDGSLRRLIFFGKLASTYT